MDATSFTAAHSGCDLSMLSEEGSGPESTFEGGVSKVSEAAS